MSAYGYTGMLQGSNKASPPPPPPPPTARPRALAPAVCFECCATFLA